MSAESLNTPLGPVSVYSAEPDAIKESRSVLQRLSKRHKTLLRRQGSQSVESHQEHHRAVAISHMRTVHNGILGHPSRVGFSGDWHGNLDAAALRFVQAQRDGVEAIIHVGDFGVWPGASGVRYLDLIAQLVEHTDIPVFFVDGNHEDFDQLAVTPTITIDSATIGVLRTGVYHLERGSVWTWGGRRFAAMGGAASTNRFRLTLGKSWWPAERIDVHDLEVLMDNTAGEPVDVLVTHDAPMRSPLPEHYRPLPMPIQMEADDSRRMITQALDIAEPKLLVHGHFHTYCPYELGPGRLGLSLAMEGQHGAFAALDLESISTP